MLFELTAPAGFTRAPAVGPRTRARPDGITDWGGRVPTTTDTTRARRQLARAAAGQQAWLDAHRPIVLAVISRLVTQIEQALPHAAHAQDPQLPDPDPQLDDDGMGGVGVVRYGGAARSAAPRSATPITTWASGSTSCAPSSTPPLPPSRPPPPPRPPWPRWAWPSASSTCTPAPARSTPVMASTAPAAPHTGYAPPTPTTAPPAASERCAGHHRRAASQSTRCGWISATEPLGKLVGGVAFRAVGGVGGVSGGGVSAHRGCSRVPVDLGVLIG